MNREIKFRGQDMKGRWCYGSLDYNDVNNEAYIIEYVLIDHDGVDFGEYTNRVLEGTVGQYTGLKDKKGKEIYEGDIVRTLNDKETGVKGEMGEIKWYEGFCGFGIDFIWFSNAYLSTVNTQNLEVVGNIYENPELLDSSFK